MPVVDILVQGEKALLNIYSVITVNPKKNDRINAAGGFLGNITGQRWMNHLGGSISVKDAQTALFVADGRTGEQIASVQGSATATDFGVSFVSRSGLNSVGAFGKSAP